MKSKSREVKAKASARKEQINVEKKKIFYIYKATHTKNSIAATFKSYLFLMYARFDDFSTLFLFCTLPLKIKNVCAFLLFISIFIYSEFHNSILFYSISVRLFEFDSRKIQ